MKLVLIFSLVLATFASKPVPSKVDQLRHDVLNNIDILWKEVDDTNDINSAPSLKDTDLMNVFRIITRNISETENATIILFPETVMWSLEWAQVSQEAYNLGEFFNTFKRLQVEPVRWRHELAWTDAAKYFLDSTENGVNKTLTKLHSYALGEHYSIFDKAYMVRKKPKLNYLVSF